jgi:Protein of unknown function (DUF2516)
MILDGFFTLANLLSFAAFLLIVFAFIDSAIRPAQAYVAAGKQNKNMWMIILGVAAAAVFFLGGSIFSIFTVVGVIAALIYMLDVRPAVKEIGGRRGDDGRHMGPYGPW